MGRKIRLAGIAYESLVNGPGIRRVFFSQGCKHNCSGCFNKETHDFNLGEDKDIDILVKDVLDNPMLDGVTFSGGDPFFRAEDFSYMAKMLKLHNINIWAFTGYKIEFILENIDLKIGFRNLIENIDVLVDGKFEEDKMNESLKFRGSSNQRIIDIKRTLNENKIILLDKYM